MSDRYRHLAFIEGPHAYLRPLLEEDATGPYPGWFNDAEVCAQNSHHVFPQSPETVIEYIKAARNSKSMLVLAICDGRSGKHLGNVSLLNINYINRNAEFAIILGAREAWGKGIGTFAFHALLEHAFTSLNLHKVYWGTTPENKGMLALSKNVGAMQEGQRREFLYKNGKYIDLVDFGLLKEEYLKRKGKKLRAPRKTGK